MLLSVISSPGKGRAAGARLTEADVVRIREHRAAGAKAGDLAAEYGVSVSLICQICIGDLWARAGGPRSRRLRDARRPAVDRFWEQVAKAGPDECWPWTGGTDGDGYGRLFIGGVAVQAHRFSLELRIGRSLADDEVSRHAETCGGNRLCCNPGHLDPGAVADNNRDTVQRGRQARGEGSGTARLTGGDVMEIRRLAGAVPFSALAQRFGVSDRAARYIAEGKRWKHLPLTPVASPSPAVSP